MYCIKCGKEIKEGSKFCGNCGKLIGNTVATKYHLAEGVQEKANTNKWKFIVGIAASVAVLLAGGVITALFYDKPREVYFEQTLISDEEDVVIVGTETPVREYSASHKEAVGESQTIENEQQTDSLMATKQQERPIRQKIWYDCDGNIERIYEYSYDDSGSIIKEVRYTSSNNNWSSELKIEYKYDYDNKVQEVWYNDYWKRYEYYYDDVGNLLKEACYDDSEHTLVYDRIYEYDEEEKPAGYNEGDKIQYHSESEYDNHGNLIKYIRYNTDGSMAHWTEYSYDRYGNLLSEIWYNNEGSICGRMEYIRDEENELDDTSINQLMEGRENRGYNEFISVSKDMSYQGVDWKDAYKAFLETEAEVPDWDNYPVVGLGYVNDDDIPELFIAVEDAQVFIRLYTFWDGGVKYLDTFGGQGASISYGERKNIVLVCGAMMGSTYMSIYRLTDGELLEVEHANYEIAPWELNDYDEGVFSWNDDVITGEEYFSRLDVLYNVANYAACDMTLDELYLILDNGL